MENSETIFQIKNYDRTMIIKHDHSDVTLNELIEDFVSLMVGITFPHSCVIQGLEDYVEEHKETIEEE